MRRILTGLLAALTAVAMLVVSGSTPAPAATAGVRPAVLPTLPKIMTVGDSLTIGYGSSDGQGYRRDLGRLLTAAGVTPTWTTHGQEVVGPITVQDIRAGIDGWIVADQPDIILLAIGTNNASGQKTAMSGVEAAIHDLLNRIVWDAPNAVVYLAQIQYSSASWSVSQPYIVQYTIQSVWEHPGKAYLAAMDAIPVCGWLYDNVHPRNAGYDAMARQWYRAMTPNMGLPAIPPDAWDGQIVRRPGFERPAVMTC